LFDRVSRRVILGGRANILLERTATHDGHMLWCNGSGFVLSIALWAHSYLFILQVLLNTRFNRPSQEYFYAIDRQA
jgi:hypothetical protein